MADERDPKLSQRYRELGAEEPPAELDRSILAASRRAVDRPHAPLVAPAGRHRWYYSLAAAAVLLLAVAVTIHVERQQPDPEAVPVAPAAPLEMKRDEVPARKEAPLKKQIAAAARAEAPAGDVAKSAQASPEAPSSSSALSRARSDSRQMQSGPAARSAMAESAAAESPERWLERIAELRKQERHEEADKQLAEFRRRYPDFRIPAAALEKVERK